MDATLEGYAWLPRMIDKARAFRAGTLGDYYRYPCPIDTTCLRRLGIDAVQFADICERATDDNDILELLRQHGVEPPERATFDPVKLNDELHKIGS